ncbi:MAG: hypothetical protein Kow00127_00990 [Bacteroidales bacterium]
MAQEKQTTVVIDTECPVCIATARIIDKTEPHRFRFVSRQQYQESTGAGVLPDSIIVPENDSQKHLDRADAVFHILRNSKYLRIFYPIKYILPKPVANRLYDLIAKNRHTLSQIFFNKVN